MTADARRDDRLWDAAQRGDTRVVAQVISALERDVGPSADLLSVDEFAAASAHVVGLTGAPGVGKSTSIAQLLRVWRGAGLKIAVLAVDPSSDRTGGAVLGDRARMGVHAEDPGVFIRSMAARGHLGGLSRAVPRAVQALVLAGYDRIVVETVGVGQSEIEVATLVDTTCLLTAPGMGDALQALKAGVMEVGDVLVVTKGDLAGAADVSRGLRSALGSGLTPSGWRVPIVTTSAVDATGFEDVVAALEQHHSHVRSCDLRRSKAVARSVRQITDGAMQLARSELTSSPELGQLADDYVRGHVHLDAAARALFEELHSRGPGPG